MSAPLSRHLDAGARPRKTPQPGRRRSAVTAGPGPRDGDDADAEIDRQITLVRRHLPSLLRVAVERAASTPTAYLEVTAGPDAPARARGRPPLRLRLSDHAPSRADAVDLRATDRDAWIDAVAAAADHFGLPLPKPVARARQFRGRR